MSFPTMRLKGPLELLARRTFQAQNPSVVFHLASSNMGRAQALIPVQTPFSVADFPIHLLL